MQGNCQLYIDALNDITHDGAGYETMFEGSVLRLTTECTPGQSTGKLERCLA